MQRYISKRVLDTGESMAMPIVGLNLTLLTWRIW